ncbi:MULTISPECIES: glycosyltransferase [unclassified Paenibacillus]|uniref:glycosyltransferase family 8 protein n=1 Tax=unclassified Paenibacillus TaxID=185978 RepID=UPI00240685FD|nr:MULTISPECIES: glycosyltransferase [unclassified Paenibacillus]MDF9844046.1 lipopolysaccharide biosynthesis glycosyltransferase [Paenibacillus sp. PastF-2]MDF9850651.1 lipopolysaccharide biosynthesis glycosyltransferase [Paenibacillus sp. PastM-2]MDF9857198.1 lipopolysaccharide biosynthesis glycosyltransferase [Paenibacillus sp. PastF-1]MDH6482501.1 lipopolysaccharide biosynthesis glycosyltransferase [Paenibacillus sp. PastH-2]MDH6509896.1 lipopolysaccharide biosynthesis glycosyltransferase 
MRLNVAYATGEVYAKHAGISMISLFDNNKNFEEIYVYIIDNGISQNTKKKLLEISFEYNRKIIFIEFNDICDIRLFKDVGNYSKIIFSKMYLHKIEEIEKIIYIDCDMIVKDSFYELWEMSMEKYLVAGVRMPTPIQYIQKFSSGNNDKYINGGFILFNLENWRSFNVEEKIKEFMVRHKNDIYIEENIICNICKDSILVLHPKYNLNGLMIAFNSFQIKKISDEKNYYSQKLIEEAKNFPTIIHFSSEIYNRPWFRNCNHPYKDEYLKYLKVSPWSSMKLEKDNVQLKIRIRNALRIYLPFNIYLIIRKLLKSA